MTDHLQDAISAVIERIRTAGGVLHVADAAVRLADEHGGDCYEIASLITNAGLLAGLNMEISTPDREHGTAKTAAIR
jgi:hypothetical protein